MNYADKFIEAAKSLIQEIKKTSELNKAGYNQANSLISDGKVIMRSSWKPPSNEEENAYIKKNGIEEYSKWFLGEDNSTIATTKGNWSYIYTSDFENIDRAGLIAIRQRAGQQNQQDIFAAAGRLLEKIDA
jgi:hypothetical protein